MMRSVKFDPEDPTTLASLTDKQRKSWEDWKKKADNSTNRALDYWNEHKKLPRTNDAIWAELKQWLLDNIFFDKCAYCESKIGASSFGDAEHYRPKGKVTIKNNGSEDVVKTADGKDHPGYFWLAYNWRNLLPACQRCNSTGKGTLFPVGETHRFDPSLDPDRLDELEKPLLLHPYVHNPADHLEFKVHGFVKAKLKSDLGERSIETYLLDRDKLRGERDQRQQESKLAFKDALNKLIEFGTPIAKTLEPWVGPKAHYSAAVKAYIDARRAELITDLSAEPHNRATAHNLYQNIR